MFNINEKNTDKIVKFCRQDGIEVIGKIPFNKIVVEALAEGKIVVEYAPKIDVSVGIRSVWSKILSLI